MELWSFGMKRGVNLGRVQLFFSITLFFSNDLTKRIRNLVTRIDGSTILGLFNECYFHLHSDIALTLPSFSFVAAQ